MLQLFWTITLGFNIEKLFPFQTWFDIEQITINQMFISTEISFVWSTIHFICSFYFVYRYHNFFDDVRILGVLISVSCVGWYCGLKHFTKFLFTKYLKGFAFNFAKRINFVFQYSVAQFIINIHDIFAKIMCLKV